MDNYDSISYIGIHYLLGSQKIFAGRTGIVVQILNPRAREAEKEGLTF